MATKAIENLVTSSGRQIQDVDYIIVTTFTPNFYTPSCAALVQRTLELPKHVGVLDINAACAGCAGAVYRQFIYNFRAG